jgi:hypothetical protein
MRVEALISDHSQAWQTRQNGRDITLNLMIFYRQIYLEMGGSKSKGLMKIKKDTLIKTPSDFHYG